MPNYIPYEPEQAELLPRHVRDELPAGHLCFRIHQLIEGLDLNEYDSAYGEEGQRAYNPRLMLKVWLYGFAVNVRSTRKLEQRIHEDLAFRFLAGGARPDHKTLSEFLRRHESAVDELFAQVLGAMRQAGMVRLGRVAIDSTRIKANAAPDRLEKIDRKQVRRWRRELESEDPDQDPGLEINAEQAERWQQQIKQVRSGRNEMKQSLTDPDARFLRERGGKFRLGYSGELAVSEDHVITAVRITQHTSDNGSLLPMIAEVERRCRQRPQKVLADSGFYSSANLDGMRELDIDGYVPDSNLARELNTGQRAAGMGRNPHVQHQETQRMRTKLRTAEGRKLYQRRKAMVEPVIGTLKEHRGMRQFLRRGLKAVTIEWVMAAISYNITRLHQHLS